MGKEAFVPCTQIVQPCFPVGRPKNAILRTPSIAQCKDLAFQAIAGKGVPFELSECPLGGTFDEIDQSGFTDIPQVVFSVDEVIAGKEISIVLDHRNIPAGFLEDAQGMFLPQGLSCRLIEDLDIYLPDVLAHPLIKNGAEKSTEGLRGHGARTHISIRVRSGFHKR